MKTESPFFWAPKFVIGLNNYATNDPCALCGERADPVVGPELFLLATWDVVCRACGRKHAPDLTDLIEQGECTLFDDVEEIFLEGKNDEIIYQVGRAEIRAVVRGETAGLPDWIVAKIREKYRPILRSTSVYEVTRRRYADEPF